MEIIKMLLSILFVILTPAYSFAVTSNGKNIDDKVLEKYVPDFLKTDSETGDPQSLSDGIRVFSYDVKLDGNQQEYVVLQYFDRMDRCSLRVLKKERNSFTLSQETILQTPTIVNGCFEIEEKDLDLDGKPELVVSTMFGKEVGEPAIFRWNGRQLVDITPVENRNGKTVKKFREMTVSTKPIGNKLLIIDVDPGDKFAKKRIYHKEGNVIKLDGEYDLVSFIPVGDEVTIKPEFPSEGVYILESEILANHARAVRAQVTVNGSKVLSPQDFCQGKQPDKKDKMKWSGKDDDDDTDFDHCKRCIPKKNIYAVVNLNKTNEIKVKVNGKKDSVLRLTLVKK